jgi:hypothetical protein
MPLQLLSDETVIEVCDKDLGGIVGPCEDVTYKVRQLPQPVARELAKKHTKRVPNPSTHRMDELVNNDALLDDAIDYIVVGWSGVNYPNGQPADCTRENKVQGLDAARKMALSNIAASNQSAAESRADSFRGTP